MSKIGKIGTILSIFSGFIFLAWGLVFISWSLTPQGSGNGNELCFIAAIPVLIYGIILVIGGFRQLKGIREGKEYHMPSDDLK